MNVRAVERQSIEESLRRALERNEFALHYQPKIDLKTGEITGAEALIRWTHPARGLIPPAQFIPVAEDCGLILPIGNWVLREACRQAQAWRDAGLPLRTMAVNISAMEFRDEGFLEGLFSVLAETGLDPKLLELELTESVLMKHAESGGSHPPGAARARRAGRGRRLRHRLFEPELSPEIPDRYAQDRPVLHPPDHRCVRGDDHRDRGDQHGPKPQAAGRRRGRRNGGGTGVPAGSPM